MWIIRTLLLNFLSKHDWLEGQWNILWDKSSSSHITTQGEHATIHFRRALSMKITVSKNELSNNHNCIFNDSGFSLKTYFKDMCILTEVLLKCSLPRWSCFVAADNTAKESLVGTAFLLMSRNMDNCGNTSGFILLRKTSNHLMLGCQTCHTKIKV